MSFAGSSSVSVTVISNIFHPDQLGGAALMTDLALFLRDRGYQVSVVSTFPYYPRWEVAPEDRGVWVRTDEMEGIPVRRVWMYVPSTPSTIRRMFSDLSYFLSLSLAGRKAWRKADVIITTCPMFSQMVAMRVAHPFGRTIPKLAIVQDFVVDAALELKMIKNPLVGFLLRKLERWAFRSCDVITTISREMLTKLEGITGPDRRTLFVPNWIHKSLAEAIESCRALEVPRKNGLLYYSGNVGRKQGLPQFLEGFEGTASGWRLKVNGGGADFERLIKSAAGRADVELSPLQGEAAFIEALNSCTACLVTQRPGVGANFLPSKILPALASGTPILAICERDSPLAREVTEANCGEVADWSDSGALNAILRKWSDNPKLLWEYARNSLVRAARYERGVVLQQYLTEIEALVKCRKG